ncbi:helix-turn-helix domain-containing protein [Labedella endophytica]|uniref:helix-turn-helix domain-containing protein n=1 Tax=Labedella endophytica TaxID=1523160 RepID=UPI001FB70148|nr:helix-turn-helix domain-containing protein [Labedella endophytica]
MGSYWAVRWQFPGDEAVAQRIVDFPAITLSIEDGDVPAPFMVTTVRPDAWSRVIRGRGTVFALRLKPAGLHVLSDLEPTSLTVEQALTCELDPRAFEAMRAIAAGHSIAERASRADRIIAEMIRERPIGTTHALANAAVDALTSSARVRSGRAVADRLGISERTLQRALRSTIGLGPNDVARRIRLQEVVRLLSTPGADTASIAAELGYVDQAHLINEFRAVAGTTPGRYLRDLRRSLEGVSTTDGGA